MRSIRYFFLRWLERERQSDWLFPWEKKAKRYRSFEKRGVFENIDG